MASANFRLGTAATNSAATVWSWRAYDTAVDAAAASYVKLELESNTGVGSLSVSIESADETTLAAGKPTVTTVQASKTATFRTATAVGRTYLVRALINGGIDQNGDTIAAYDKKLAVHRKTTSGLRKIAVGEVDEADRTYGYTPKLNAIIQDSLGSSGVVSGTYANPTMTVDYRGIVTSCATGATAGVFTGGSITLGTGATAVNMVESGGVLRIEDASGALGTIYSSTYRSGLGTMYLRETATGTGDGLIDVYQGTGGTHVKYGYDQSEGRFGASYDSGSTWTYLGDGPKSYTDATAAYTPRTVGSGGYNTVVSISPLAGSYGITAFANCAIGISSTLYSKINVGTSTTAVGNSEYSLANSGYMDNSMYVWTGVVTVTTGQTVTMKTYRSGGASATIVAASILAVKVTP